MQFTRYTFLVLFSSLWIFLTGCEHRDTDPVNGVRIKLDWDKLTGRTPKDKWVIIYPEDRSLKPLLHKMSEDELVDSLPVGHYNILMFAMDKEVTCHEFIDMKEFESATMVLKGPIKDWQYPNPEMVYGAQASIDLINNKVETISLIPKSLVMKVAFTIRIPGIHELHACLKGIPTAIRLKDLSPVYVDPQNCIELVSEYVDHVLSLSGAILMPNNLKSGTRVLDTIALLLEIDITYDDGSTEKIGVDVTKVIYNAASDESEEVVFNLEKVGMSAMIVGWTTENTGGEVIVQ